MNFGLLIILIAVLGYFSNWLNWRHLNYLPIRILYYLGAAVHEFSHAIFCILCGARITEFSIFSKQPRVTASQPKIPVLGNFLISLAPLIGGLIFLFLLNKYFLNEYFTPSFNLLPQINLLEWQSWVMIFLSFNMGAMLGPSFLDLKNIWLLVIICFFIKWPLLMSLGFLALGLIITNILIQLALLLVLRLLKLLTHHYFAL